MGSVVAMRVRTLALTVLLVAAACTQGASSYFPLDAGRRWEYRVRTTILGETTSQRQIVRNLASARWHGQDVTVQESGSGFRRYYAAAPEGIKRLLADPAASDGGLDGQSQTVLGAPYAAGTQWRAESRLSLIESRTFEPADRIIPRRRPVTLTYVIESVNDEVTVAAGSFSGCLRVSAGGSARVEVNRGNEMAVVRVSHTDWYARGIGLIKTIRSEDSDSTFLTRGEYAQELHQWE